MPKYVVPEQMHAPGCFCFQALEGCHEITFFCQDRGRASSRTAAKAKMLAVAGSTSRSIETQCCRKSSKGSVIRNNFIHVMKRLAIMVARLAKGQHSTCATQEVCQLPPIQLSPITRHRSAETVDCS